MTYRQTNRPPNHPTDRQTGREVSLSIILVGERRRGQGMADLVYDIYIQWDRVRDGSMDSK